MWLPFALSVAFVIGIVIASLLWRREVNRGGVVAPTAAPGDLPFEKAASVLDETERTLYPLLTWAVDKDGYVLAKVSAQQLVGLPRSAPRRDIHLRVLKSRIIDFVITDRDFAPQLAIQLGDRPREGKGMTEDQAFIDAALRPAGIPVLWLPPRRSYMPHELKAMVREAIYGPAAAAGDGQPGPDAVNPATAPANTI